MNNLKEILLHGKLKSKNNFNGKKILDLKMWLKKVKESILKFLFNQ
jgi:hypothetical protein